MIETRAISVSEITQSLLARIDSLNPHLNAIVASRAEAALGEASKMDSLRNSALGGPLFGIPFTVKDSEEAHGFPTTYGSKAFANSTSTFELVAISRLRAAGGIILGKTNTPEFGLLGHTDNLLFGPTANPWNFAYSAGGSSGGAGAAVASGMCPMAEGSDGGGSARIPASCCGVVGLKPTRGRIPWAPRAYERWAGFTTPAPLARTVRDVALMLDVMAGPVLGEPYGVSTPEIPFLQACERRSKRHRLAILMAPPHGHIDPAVEEIFLRGIRVFESLGHDIETIQPKWHDVREDFLKFVAVHAASAIRGMKISDDRLADLHPNTLALLYRGLSISGPAYCTALDALRREGARVIQQLSDFDFLVTPTLPQLPPRTADYSRMYTEDSLDWLAFTYLFNISGQPAISLPYGWTREAGLPVGIQVVGAPGDEGGLLALSAQFEEASPWLHRRPNPASFPSLESNVVGRLE